MEWESFAGKYVYNLSSGGEFAFAKPLEWGLLLVIAVCVLSIVIDIYRRKKDGFAPSLLLICTLCALVIPVSVDYTLPMLVAPLVIFLSSLSEMRGSVGNRLVSILLMLTISVSYASLLYPFKYKPDWLQNSFPGLFLILVTATVYYFLQGKFAENGQPES